MSEKHTKKVREPSAASLRAIPEVDFSRVRAVGRGRHAARARRSLTTIVVDRRLVRALGGPDALTALLEAIANSLGASRRRGRAA
jgi:hypothetical protein